MKFCVRVAVVFFVVLAFQPFGYAAPGDADIHVTTYSEAIPWTQALKPRVLQDKHAMPLMIDPQFSYEVVVKFKDFLLARADKSTGSLMLREPETVGLNLLLNEYGVRFEPLIKLPAGKLKELEERAARMSGNSQPDLSGILIAKFSDQSPERSLAFAEALRDLDLVEYVHLNKLNDNPPPPGDYAPPTPDLSSHQGYLTTAGINAEYAWSNGVYGSGIRLSNCEYGYNGIHEDLVDQDLSMESGQTINTNVFIRGWDKHGTATLGEIISGHNGYGMKGIAPSCTAVFYPEWERRVTCIANAIADSSIGDVVMLEMQTGGVDPVYVPAEYDLSVWTTIKTGTDAGVIVVAAAGNGGVDLDGFDYADYRSRGDSGAIIVGAGDATTRERLDFSTYGARVNVHGWGGGVATLDYGTLAIYGSDANQRYAASFGGTSSATPIVAGACILLQDYYKQLSGGDLLEPLEMRQLLIDTGLSQGTSVSGHIGPLPNVHAAMEYLESTVDSDNDGLPDGWEIRYFGDFQNVSSNTMAANGINNLYEVYLADLDPTDSNALFRIDHLIDDHIVSWMGSSNRQYIVFFGSDLIANNFLPLWTNELIGGMSSFTNHNPTGSKGFYKVMVGFPE